MKVKDILKKTIPFDKMWIDIRQNMKPIALLSPEEIRKYGDTPAEYWKTDLVSNSTLLSIEINDNTLILNVKK